MTLDGEELRFTTGHYYEISLKDTLHISVDLLKHGIQVNDTRVHLIEVELELEAFPDAHVSVKAVQSEREQLLSSVRATSSVAFSSLEI